jgi:small subunit ribosomal protein S20
LANHKSSLKRAKQDEKKRLRNKIVKTQLKNAVKSVRTASTEKSGDLSKMLQETQSTIDKAAKKGVIHKRTAARKISRLAKLANKTAAA